MRSFSYKQYLISNRPLSIEGVTCYLMDGELHLYAGENLPVRQGFTKGGLQYFLLGEAYCTNHFPSEAVEELELCTDGDIFSVTKYWTGRWVLILGNNLITDACGLMSAFYHTDESGWMISSSIALLSDRLGLAQEQKVAETGLTWQLLPSTIQPSVRLLFCTQKMTLGHNLSVNFSNRFEEWKGISYDQRLSAITDNLVNGIKNINRYSGKRIWLALTAGKDSRLSFAAALSAGIQFETYTAMHCNISKADRRLPEVISRKYGIVHHLLHKKKVSKKKYEEYCSFCGYNSLGADAEFYATGQFDQIPSDAVVIKSGLFEAGQTYARRIAGGERASFIKGMRSYYSSSFRDKRQVAAFEEWLAYQDEYPVPGLDIRDRFYLEQRLTGWASAIEQSLSINPFASIQIANSAAVLGSLLYASEEDRKGLKLSYDLIRALKEDLLEYPVNRQSILDWVRIVLNGLKRRISQ